MYGFKYVLASNDLTTELQALFDLINERKGRIISVSNPTSSNVLVVYELPDGAEPLPTKKKGWWG